MNDLNDEAEEFDETEVLQGGSPAEDEDVSGIRHEVVRRELILEQLRAEHDELHREFKKLSPKTLVLAGDIGKLQMLDRYRRIVRQKIRKQVRKIREAESDLQRAQEHLKSVAGCGCAPADSGIEEE